MTILDLWKPQLSPFETKAMAERHIVYVHGICNHQPGFSNPWFEAMEEFVPSLQPGELGMTAAIDAQCDAKDRVFVDRAHLTDHGNQICASILMEHLKL